MPSLLPSLRRGRELSLGGFQVLRVFDIDRGAEWNENFLDLDSICWLLLQILSCSGVRNNTIWQGLKWASHLMLHRFNYRLSCNAAFEVGDAHFKWQYWKGNRLFWMWALFEEGIVYLAWWFMSLLLDTCRIPSGVVLPSFGIRS